MLTIYWNPLSSPSNKVLFCANALGLDYQKVLVDLQNGEQRSAEFLARNPFGKVPVIDDDGFVLFESDAILRYLARREKSVLYPSTYHERARVDQWMDFSSFMLYLAMQKIFFHRLLAPMLGLEPDEKIIQQGQLQVDSYLPVYEKRLSSSKYLCGEDMTLADIALLAVLDSAESTQVDLSVYSKLSQWRQSLRTQDFYIRVHAWYGEGIFPVK